MPARQRIPRLAEFIVLFLVLPAGLSWLGAAGAEIPVIPILVGIGGLASLYLVRAAPAQLRAALVAPWQSRELRRIGFQLLVGAALLAAWVLAVHPERLFQLPLRQPRAWALFVGLYPLLSVLPQELVFRAFFFQRYGALWSGTAGPVLASALVFGLAHIFYGHWLSVGLATAGGLLFSWTFARTGSLVLVVLEHSAYGVLVFTLGLGRFFHLPH
jgi:membrane protease YdiL (CAAX protease family)